MAISNVLDFLIKLLHFSLFAVLYPSGITGELGCMYMAAKYLWDTNVSVRNRTNIRNTLR